MNGKTWRLRRIIDPVDGRTIVLPMDHGVSLGPIPGLVSPESLLSAFCRVIPDAVVLHKGLVRFLPRSIDPRMGLIIHLSASTVLGTSDRKVRVTSPDDALAMGADGVSVHVNFGGPHESHMLADLGRVADRCQALGLPLLVMAYLRGGSTAESDTGALAHAARVCAELGADLVKIPWPGSPEALREIVSGCPVGVVIAGGECRESFEGMQLRVQTALDAGAIGIAAGRTIFQTADPCETLETLSRLIHVKR